MVLGERTLLDRVWVCVHVGCVCVSVCACYVWVCVCVCLCACVCVCVFLWRTLTTQQGPLAEGGSPVVPAKGGAFERTLVLGTLCFCF